MGGGGWEYPCRRWACCISSLCKYYGLGDCSLISVQQLILLLLTFFCKGDHAALRTNYSNTQGLCNGCWWGGRTVQYNVYAWAAFEAHLTFIWGIILKILPHNFSLQKPCQHTIKVGSWLFPYFAEENSVDTFRVLQLVRIVLLGDGALPSFK